MDDVREVISDQNAFYLNQHNFLNDINFIVNNDDAVLKISKADVERVFKNSLFCGFVIENIDNCYLLDYQKLNELKPTRCILDIRFNPKYQTFKFINEIITKFKEKYKDTLVISGVSSSKKHGKKAVLKAFFTSDEY